MNYAPIVMFVYNRADHFAETYNALAACKEAKESELFIFSDGAKNPAGEDKVNQVREAVKSIVNKGDFKNVTVFASEKNKGLAASVIEGVTQVIQKYGRVIVVEDDCVVSPYFLDYMNNSLEFYKDDNSVGAISGYVPVLELPSDYKKDVFSAFRSCSCSWATWARSWQGVDWELDNFADFYKDLSLIKRLNANGSDRFMRLYRQTKGNGSSWSVRFGAHLVKNNLVTVYPRYSYISNIGCDESGVHSKVDDAEKMRVDLNNSIKNPVLETVGIDNRIQKIMKKHYSYGFISELKKAVFTAMLIIKYRLKG